MDRRLPLQNAGDKCHMAFCHPALKVLRNLVVDRYTICPRPFSSRPISGFNLEGSGIGESTTLRSLEKTSMSTRGPLLPSERLDPKRCSGGIHAYEASIGPDGV